MVKSCSPDVRIGIVVGNSKTPINFPPTYTQASVMLCEFDPSLPSDSTVKLNEGI
ncbi:MAG: hypothetical protein KJP21_01925 [Bacteroidia bacterium]|nr:hypothetical protein [Bacteroidia bacterium]NNJ55942.1 hypothetical protein [Bacteroidia bacterium]